MGACPQHAIQLSEIKALWKVGKAYHGQSGVNHIVPTVTG